MSWYDPKDAEKPVLPKGDYDAVIESVEVHIAKDSKEKMRKLSVRVYPNDPDTPSVLLFDYLGKKSTWKIKQVAKCVGQDAEFDAGTFEPIGITSANVKVKVSVQPDNFNGGEKNGIGGYFLPLPSADMGEPKPARTIPVTNARSNAGGYASGGGLQSNGDIDIPFAPDYQWV